MPPGSLYSSSARVRRLQTAGEPARQRAREPPEPEWISTAVHVLACLAMCWYDLVAGACLVSELGNTVDLMLSQ